MAGNNFNIPPMNDLNADGDHNRGFLASVKATFSEFIVRNGEWTASKDFAVRLSVPIVGMILVAAFKRMLDEKEKSIHQKELQVDAREEALRRESDEFRKMRDDSGLKSVTQLIDDLASQEDVRAKRAKEEIDLYQPLIRKILDVRCSDTTPRSEREPIEKELTSRLLAESSPLHGFPKLKENIFTDLQNIYKKDVRHCDTVWPFGSGNNGELYKIYRENWILQVELAKYKRIVAKLRQPCAVSK